ncbi:MAG: universal stress protein [Methanomassiliicoccaceae archaeon]|jgi:nucleotide-binding universal stress UspA family protein|nr:universal stress protein [Methanomassiliicoccaceae archaeon]
MTILLAYNWRSQSDKVLDYAIGYALAYGQPLYILSSITSKDAADSGDKLGQIKARLEAAKEKASKRGTVASTLIGIGPATEEIIAAAERINAEAIIVGHSDKTAIDRILMGTISEQVMRNANRIVIVVQ